MLAFATAIIACQAIIFVLTIIVAWLRYNSIEARVKQLEDFHGHEWISQTLYPPNRPR